MSYDLYLPRLRTRFLLPSSHPEAFHQCFLNAIYLGACVVAGPDFAEYEKLFLDRCLVEKENALSQVDRMEDCVWSTIMLGWYHLRQGNDLAAHALGNCTSSLSTPLYPLEVSNGLVWDNQPRRAGR